MKEDKEAKQANGPDLTSAENANKFFRGAPGENRQKSLINSPGAQSELFSGRVINPIIDSGFRKSVGGVKLAAALALALGIDFKLRDLDCQPFIHGYGPPCSKASLVFAMWDMPICDLNDKDEVTPFYITPGDGFLLLDNNVLHKSNQMGYDNILRISKDSHELVFPNYTEDHDDGYLRTYLFLVPKKRKD